MTAPLLIERDGPVTVLTLNDPEQRNALSQAMVDALIAALEEASRDLAVGCAVLTGAGSSFCSGGNLKDMRDGTHPMFAGSPSDMQEAYRHSIQLLPRAFHAADVPLVAAVNGPAIGAGCDMATMCDVRIASDRARFAESFLRVGLISGDGGAWFLPRVVGYSKAMEMALTCDEVGAEEAQRIGLVSRVVAPDALLPAALDLARRIAAQPRRATRLTKRLVRDSQGVDLSRSLEMAAAFQSIVQHTRDHREALDAIFARRKPSYSGD